MNNFGKETEPVSSRTRVLDMNQLDHMFAESKAKISDQVSAALGRHVSTMLQYSSDEIVKMIDEGRAVVALNENDDLDGFAQLSPWYDEDEQIGAIEFRGWLSMRPGVGTKLLKGAVELSRERYPGVGVYAVVEENNQRAQSIMLAAGGQEVTRPDAIKVILKAGEEPAPVKTYDITNLSRE